MTTKQRITTAIATGAVLLNALAPMALAADATVTGNGAFSDSTVKLDNNSKTTVDQNNNADVKNNISTNNNTGDNTSSFNTGGDTKIVTGDAASKVKVSTDVNVNKADLKNVGSNNNTDVKISGNGAYSDNKVKVDDSNKVKLEQNNNADIKNKIDTKANTGKNDSSFNTGGDSIIVTGDATSKVDVKNKANANIANIGSGDHGYSDPSVNISGNGAFSDNKAKLNESSATVLKQNNNADIYNDVKTKANTGENRGAFNTGGDTAIVTGDAGSKVKVDNKANFNAASLDDGYVYGDQYIKISGNGAESRNSVKSNTDNLKKVTQNNNADIYNDVYNKNNTGKNDVSFSTGNVHGDPLIATGDSYASTDVKSKGNVNMLDEGIGFSLPGGLDIKANFDLGDLFGNLLHL